MANIDQQQSVIQPLITEEWLKSVGFKWHQMERQPSKHWVLWIADTFNAPRGFSDAERLGIELADSADGEWFCWLRSDCAGYYHRFIHIRELKTQDELIQMIEGLTGQEWDVANNHYGSMKSPEQAARIRRDDERLDRRLARDRAPWSETEKDETRGAALPEHLEIAAKALEQT